MQAKSVAYGMIIVCFLLKAKAEEVECHDDECMKALPRVIVEGLDSYLPKPADAAPVEVQTEIKTVIKEVIVEVDGQNEGSHQAPHIEDHAAITYTDNPAIKAISHTLGAPTSTIPEAVIGPIPLSSSIKIADASAASNASQHTKCYVAAKDIHDGNTAQIESILLGFGANIVHKYVRNTTGISFCSDSQHILPKLTNAGISAEEDKFYTVSSVQNTIPNYMYLMKHYENYILNNYVYDSLPFRLLQIKRIITSFFGFYEYHYTGKGVEVLLLDTTVNARPGNLSNLSKSMNACNRHGDIMAELIIGTTNGFAKNSHLSVIDVVGCDGRVSLSNILRGLEDVPKWIRPQMLVFGVSGPHSHILNAVVDRISTSGTVVVAPAGNMHDQSCNYSPGSSKSAITVGSVDKHARISLFSNHGSCVRMFALGEQLFDDVEVSGTSFSAAIVAGAIALFLEKRPGSVFQQVWKYLNQNSFWNSEGSYNVLKIPHLESEDYYQSSFFQFTEIQNEIVMLVVFSGVILALIFLFLLIWRYFARKKRSHDDDDIFFENQ
ncbi:putative subtilisin-like serine protease [Ordospora pajunii]|uniref:putative subtilisin-like serine protease n=1 Tax=Ordospora pajunii TaxID=3039483 RepID=UPI0029528926|nr:putative subtilisin-like serine protease [Ordospora pajunii]KAH9411740.1 putative subtilisin-like serine protease [Ordospora pajunii]